MRIKLGLFFILIIFLGCNYNVVKTGGNSDDLNAELSLKLSLSEDEKLKLSYNLIDIKILQPKCTGCHGTSGDVNLESYQNVVSALQDIKDAVFFEHTMPKRGVLTLEEQKLLWNWIAMGAPETAQSAGTENPPEPLVPTYESINKNIFLRKCITCHSAGNSGERVLLTKEDLLNSPLELVLPQNPDESGLVIAVERSDKKRMPPEKEGYAPLKDFEKAVIRKWIQDGATN